MKMGLTISATVLLISGVAGADDISGTWKVSGDVVGNAVDATCTFAGAGDKATSACSVEATPGLAAPATIAGNSVTWSWDAGQAILTFKGTLDSPTAMRGDIEVSGVTGDFTAAKQ
jgi:hypothetical protein